MHGLVMSDEAIEKTQQTLQDVLGLKAWIRANPRSEYLDWFLVLDKQAKEVSELLREHMED